MYRMSPLYLTNTNSDQFTRGFAMVCYNAAYLCHLRGFESTLEQSTYLLWQLWRCCRGSSLISPSNGQTAEADISTTSVVTQHSQSSITDDTSK